MYNAIVKVNDVKSVSKQKIYDAFFSNNYFSDGYGNIPRSFISRVSNARWASMLDTPGFFHDADGWTMSLEVPGTKKEAIEVRVDPVGRTLGVVVKEPYEQIDGTVDGEKVKQQYTVPIPGEADISVDPKATLELGILSITFPEDVATQPRIVEVTVK